MSTVNRTVNNLAKDTVKGVLLDLVVNQYQGSDNFGVISLGAAATDRETITIAAPAKHPLGDHPYRDSITTSIEGAKDVYQVVQVNVDSGVDTAGAILKNTNPDPVQINIGSASSNSRTDEGKAGEVGTMVRVGTEIMNILEVSERHTDGSPIKVVVERGYAGSTIASHNDGETVFVQANSALAEGALPIPVPAASLSAANLRGPLVAAINAYSKAATDRDEKIEVGLYPRKTTNRRYAKNTLNAIRNGSTIYLHYQAHGEELVTMTGTSATQMVSSSNTLTAFVAGTQPLGGRTSVRMSKVTAAEASGGLNFIVPFAASGVMFEDFGNEGASGAYQTNLNVANQNVSLVVGDNSTLVSIASGSLTVDHFIRVTTFA